MSELYEAALAAQKNAYCPYSKHPVGAALKTESGKIFAGCNVETAHYIATHAETSAISAMVTAGGTEIREIAIVGPYDGLCSPCGDCRQRIREFCDKETVQVHVYAQSGALLKSYTIDELLPDSFGPENIGDV